MSYTHCLYITEKDCKDFAYLCKHQGYVAKVNGQCQCVCPEGLRGGLPGASLARDCSQIITEKCGGIIKLKNYDEFILDSASMVPASPEDKKCYWLIQVSVEIEY